MSLYNCHTHIFNLACVPNKALGIPLANFISQDRVGRALGRFARWVTPGSPKRKLGRYLTFAEIGLSATQKDIFDNLNAVYQQWGKTKFIVLPMDMEQMGGGLPNKTYFNQLKEISDIRLNNHGYADILLPFFFVDPNRHGSADSVLDLVKRYIEDYSFVGIKLYPALGYYPFDERLDKMYAYCQKHQIPILTHCTQGPIHFRGDLRSKKNPRFKGTHLNLNARKKGEFQRNFTDPRNYDYILSEEFLGFKNLKINLAHYGGASNVLSNNVWYRHIKELMEKYTNVYTDISYTLYNKKLFNILLTDLKNPAIGNKILFGTDFYVVSPAKNEDKLRDEFHHFLNMSGAHDLFDKLAKSSPKEYLTSSFYIAD